MQISLNSIVHSQGTFRAAALEKGFLRAVNSRLCMLAAVINLARCFCARVRCNGTIQLHCGLDSETLSGKNFHE
jgi:hypothetical protein